MLSSVRLCFNTDPYFTPVLLSLSRPQPLAIKHNGHEDATNRQRHKRDADEAVLQAQAVEPRGDAVRHGKAHGVADEYERDEGVAGNLAKRVDEVGNGERDAGGAAQGEANHGDDEAKPVDVVRGLLIFFVSRQVYCTSRMENGGECGRRTPTPHRMRLAGARIVVAAKSHRRCSGS